MEKASAVVNVRGINQIWQGYKTYACSQLYGFERVNDLGVPIGYMARDIR